MTDKQFPPRLYGSQMTVSVATNKTVWRADEFKGKFDTHEWISMEEFEHRMAKAIEDAYADGLKEGAGNG